MHKYITKTLSLWIKYSIEMLIKSWNEWFEENLEIINSEWYDS